MRLRLFDRVRRYIRPGPGGSRSRGSTRPGPPAVGDSVSAPPAGRHRRDHVSAPGQISAGAPGAPRSGRSFGLTRRRTAPGRPRSRNCRAGYARPGPRARPRPGQASRALRARASRTRDTAGRAGRGRTRDACSRPGYRGTWDAGSRAGRHRPGTAGRAGYRRPDREPRRARRTRHPGTPRAEALDPGGPDGGHRARLGPDSAGRAWSRHRPSCQRRHGPRHGATRAAAQPYGPDRAAIRPAPGHALPRRARDGRHDRTGGKRTGGGTRRGRQRCARTVCPCGGRGPRPGG